MWPYMPIIMFIIFILFICFICRFIKKSSCTQNTQLQHETPMDILKKRYAKGEISKDQFESMKKDIM